MSTRKLRPISKLKIDKTKLGVMPLGHWYRHSYDLGYVDVYVRWNGEWTKILATGSANLDTYQHIAIRTKRGSSLFHCDEKVWVVEKGTPCPGAGDFATVDKGGCGDDA